MATLDELYQERQTILKYGLQVPETLANEIRELEEDIFSNTILWTYCHMPRKAETETKGSFTVMVEYRDDSLVNIGVRKDYPVEENAAIFITIDKAKDILGETEEDQNEETKDEVLEEDEEIDVVAEGETNEEEADNQEDGVRRKKSKSIGFTVRFADGKIIKHSKARKTMIEALRYMGLERASKYEGDSFKGYKLIGKEKRTDVSGTIMQKQVDGWWIYVNMSNLRAISCLKGVAKMLNIPMEITLDQEPSLWPDPNSVTTKGNSSKGRRALFSLNGSQPLCKNKSVHEAVREFLKNFPDAKFKDIESMFPGHLQGSYGVVRTIDDINIRKAKNRTESERWFLEDHEILHDADGVPFTVSKEWGDNYEGFRKHIEEFFGWKLTETNTENE